MSDLRGMGKAMTYNGVKTTRAEQLGSVVSLDGIDDYVFINGIRSKCINDPTLCSRGLTVAFWIKYHAGSSPVYLVLSYTLYFVLFFLHLMVLN